MRKKKDEKNNIALMINGEIQAQRLNDFVLSYQPRLKFKSYEIKIKAVILR